MNTNMQGHNHGGKSHLLWMLGIGGVVLAVQLGLGRSFGQALPLAFLLACTLMMIGMMSTMGADRHQHGNSADDANDADEHRNHNDGSNQHGSEVAAPWQDSPNMARPQDGASPDRPRRSRA